MNFKHRLRVGESLFVLLVFSNRVLCVAQAGLRLAVLPPLSLGVGTAGVHRTLFPSYPVALS